MQFVGMVSKKICEEQGKLGRVGRQVKGEKQGTDTGGRKKCRKIKPGRVNGKHLVSVKEKKT